MFCFTIEKVKDLSSVYRPSLKTHLLIYQDRRTNNEFHNVKASKTNMALGDDRLTHPSCFQAFWLRGLSQAAISTLVMF